VVDTIIQRENERGRLTVEGKRTDDGDRCSLLLVQETGGMWALYLHGAAQLGVRVTEEVAAQLARVILGGGA
jgi:hypothetical protein